MVLLCACVCFTGCKKLFEPEERPMTVEELTEFAQMYELELYNITSPKQTKNTTKNNKL